MHGPIYLLYSVYKHTSFNSVVLLQISIFGFDCNTITPFCSIFVGIVVTKIIIYIKYIWRKKYLPEHSGNIKPSWLYQIGSEWLQIKLVSVLFSMLTISDVGGNPIGNAYPSWQVITHCKPFGSKTQSVFP